MTETIGQCPAYGGPEDLRCIRDVGHGKVGTGHLFYGQPYRAPLSVEVLAEIERDRWTDADRGNTR